MFVKTYNVEIYSPNQSNPVTGILPNTSIISRVNITANGTFVSQNVTFNATIFNSTVSEAVNVNSATYNSTENMWRLNISTPNFSQARAYNLNITASYNGTSYLVRSDTENNAIVYNDTQAPQLSINTPVRVAANTSVLISVNSTETGGMKNISGVMTYPGNATSNVSFDLLL